MTQATPFAPQDRLDGKVAVIAGGTGAIGHASARRLAARGARCVLLHNGDPAAAARVAELPGEGHAEVVASITDSPALKAAADRVLDKLGVKEPSDIHLWKEDEVHRLVDTFMDFRFPTILVANKCDMPGADLNIARLCDRFGEENVVPCSALAETFLRKMAQQKYIAYQPGSDNFQMAADDVRT